MHNTTTTAFTPAPTMHTTTTTSAHHHHHRHAAMPQRIPTNPHRTAPEQVVQQEALLNAYQKENEKLTLEAKDLRKELSETKGAMYSALAKKPSILKDEGATPSLQVKEWQLKYERLSKEAGVGLPERGCVDGVGCGCVDGFSYCLEAVGHHGNVHPDGNPVRKSRMGLTHARVTHGTDACTREAAPSNPLTP